MNIAANQTADIQRRSPSREDEDYAGHVGLGNVKNLVYFFSSTATYVSIFLSHHLNHAAAVSVFPFANKLRPYMMISESYEPRPAFWPCRKITKGIIRVKIIASSCRSS
jgi:hypothetical protein